MRQQYSPYIEISLDNLLHNVAVIRSKLPAGVDVAAVVKDCSYGCGSGRIAKTLEDYGGVKIFAVARGCEAEMLRYADVKSEVLVMGMASKREMLYGVDNNVIFTLNDLSDVDRWKEYFATFEMYKPPVRCHINIDTGMSRMGILPHEVDALIEKIKTSEQICVDGVFTHMACADEIGTSSVNQQLEKFTKCIDKFRAANIALRHIHYGNSATTIRFPVDGCTLVRPGIALYGCKPDPAQDFDIDLKPVASLKSSVVKIKKVPAGTPVSYCWNYVTKTETRIATIALGYAHGLPRFLSNRGEVLINGKRYRIAGNVTMDYIMVDIGDDNVNVGDEVVAIGAQGDDVITADDVAVIGGTIAYEIICNLGTAIPRIYIRNGDVVLEDRGNVF